MNDSSNVIPMSAEEERTRAKMIRKLAPGAKLEVYRGIKKGRTALYVAPDADNPWLLKVTIDGRPAVVRFDFVLKV